MGRSAEQKAADDALREAIQNVINLMPPAPDGEPPRFGGVLTKYIVLAVQVRFEDDGDPNDCLNILYSDGHMLGYEAEGILKQADRVYAADGYRRNAGYQEEE